MLASASHVIATWRHDCRILYIILNIFVKTSYLFVYLRKNDWVHLQCLLSDRLHLFFSAVIITHLCTASTFFTLLSWLPTFFKDTFPDAKVNWTALLQTECENMICVKEYQSAYRDFSASMWELISERVNHVSMMLFWLNSSRGLHITAHQIMCLFPNAQNCKSTWVVFTCCSLPVPVCVWLFVCMCVSSGLGV